MISKDIVRTSSKLRAWYLTRFRGRKIRSVYCTPVLQLDSITIYGRSWVLIPAEDY